MPHTLTVLLIVLNAAMALFLLYTALTSVPGFFKARQKPVRAGVPLHRFAAVIAARNEENILPFLFESLRAQNYPSELIEVILIADNCTDNTAGVARDYGATVIERHDLEKIGKGYALKYAFSRLGPSLFKADAVCIFDADNIVHPDFFVHMNRAYAGGARIAQGYRQMKNPSDTWISGANALFFWMHNRFFNRARDVMGLSAHINGTGFMVDADTLRKNGWNTDTITEDIELTAQTVLSGKKVAWVPDAVIFDEQPLHFSQSFNQRKRWGLGVFQCLARYAAPLLRRFLATGQLQYLDTLVYLASVPLSTMGVLLGLGSFVYALFVSPAFALMGLLGNYLAIVAGSLLIIRLEYGAKYRGMLRPVALYPFVLLIWSMLSLFVLFNGKAIGWKPIRHVRAVSIEDMLEQLQLQNSQSRGKSGVV